MELRLFVVGGSRCFEEGYPPEIRPLRCSAEAEMKAAEACPRALPYHCTQVMRALSSLMLTLLSVATKQPWLLAGSLSRVTPPAVLTVQPAAVLTA